MHKTIGLLLAARALLAALTAAAALAGCGGGGGDPGSTPLPPFGNGNGRLQVWLTDAPACGWDSVNVTIEKVRVHTSSTADDSAAGWSEIVLAPPRRIDLLSLQNGVLTTLGQTTLPPGRYTQLRLQLAENGGAAPMANAVKPTGSAEVALKTPSAEQSGLKMNVGIDVAANQTADVVIDFDACKSVVRAGNSGNILLKPVLQVTPRYLSGVQGYIDAALLGPQTRLSLQQGGVALRSTVPDATGRFVLSPAAPGTYTLVLHAPGRATLVVNGVTVTADTLTGLGTLAAPLTAPTSPSGSLNGIVSAPGSPIDALVRVTQPLSNGSAIELAALPVDGSSGAYGVLVPTAAPQVASFGAPLVLQADTAAAGRHAVAATSGGVTKTAGPFTLGAGATVTTNFSFP